MLKRAPMALQALLITVAVAISTLSVLSAAQVCTWEYGKDTSAEGEVDGRMYFGIWRCKTLSQPASLPPTRIMPADEDAFLLTQYAFAGDEADFAEENGYNPNGTTTWSFAEAYKPWYDFVVDSVHMWRKVLESMQQMLVVMTTVYSCILMWGGFWDFRRVYFSKCDMYLGMVLIFCNYMLILLRPQPDLAEAPHIVEQIYYG